VSQPAEENAGGGNANNAKTHDVNAKDTNAHGAQINANNANASDARANSAKNSASRRAVFLDRDGTLIKNDGDLGDPALVELLPCITQGLRALREKNYVLIVVTNQGGVARGKFTEAAVQATHQRLEQLLCKATGLSQVIDAFYFCPFHPDASVAAYRGEHAWRKPAPGMLLAAAKDHALHVASSWMIGDQERDAHAGAAAGCRTILLAAAHAGSESDFFAPTLDAAAQRIVHEDAPQVAGGMVTLHAAQHESLNDPRLREAITAAAESLAERTGVRLASLTFTPSHITATVEGGEIVALGFIAELRRTTERWWHARGASGALWAGSCDHP